MESPKTAYIRTLAFLEVEHFQVFYLGNSCQNIPATPSRPIFSNHEAIADPRKATRSIDRSI